MLMPMLSVLASYDYYTSVRKLTIHDIYHLRICSFLPTFLYDYTKLVRFNMIGRFDLTDSHKKEPRRVDQSQSHMPEDSVFYEKVVPAILIGLGIVMIVLVLVAIGILTGLIPA